MARADQQTCLAGLRSRNPCQLGTWVPLDQRCLEIMLAMQTESQHGPKPPRPNQTKAVSDLGSKPPFAQSKSLIQMRTQLGVRSKADFVCCFPDNTRMISCHELLLCPHPAGKNPISKQVDAPPLLRSNYPLKTNRSDKRHERKHQTPGRQLLAQRTHTRPQRGNWNLLQCLVGTQAASALPAGPCPSPTARAVPPQQRRCRGTRLRCSELRQRSRAPAERKGEGIPPGGPGQFADGGGRKPDCQSLSSGPGAAVPWPLSC